MMPKSTTLAVATVFVVAGVALLMKFPGRKERPPAPTEEVAAVTHPAADIPQPEEVPDLPPPVPLPQPAMPRPSPVSAPDPAASTMSAPAPTPRPIGAPQERIDQILLSDELNEAEKSKKLLEMLPLLPEAYQEEAAQHMCNLMPDDAYGQLGPLLTNGVTPEPLLDVVMTDLLSRPNTLKLPILLQMARNDAHPRHDESRSVLEIYLEQDLGSDWAAWERSLQAYLKENPE